MRFDLKVPFAEKDDAKKLGARWDAARKVWYVIRPDDLTAFARWSPAEQAEMSAGPAASAGAGAPVRRAAVAPASSAGKVHVGSRYVAHPVVCDCPPWALCDRCRAFALAD